MTEPEADREALEWQIGVWNRISDVYVREIDQRFAPVVDAVLSRAELKVGEYVLDLGTGTGAIALKAARGVGSEGRVVGVDISADMLAVALKRVEDAGLVNVSLREGRGECLPAEDDSFDAVLCSLSLMYMLDRSATAREISRVLRPGGRLVATVWGAPEECDIVLFQQTAGKFSGTPPVPGVGPGAMEDAAPFLRELADAGLDAHVENEVLGFDFPDFASAWTALAGVTTAHLPLDLQQEAQRAVMKLMYPSGDAPRRFNNLTQFVLGRVVETAL